MKNKKGLSPVITSLLLVALAIVITSITFLWFKGMVEESVTKFEGKNIKLVCDDVSFSADYSSGFLSIANTGNVPIFRMNLKILNNGNYQTKDLAKISGLNWPAGGLNPGGVFSGDISKEVGSAAKLAISPVLIGSSGKGKKTFVCGERYEQNIEI